jgi:hypothetical protein
MVKIADDFTGAPEPESDRAKPSASSRLVEMALERYSFGLSEDGQPYAVKPGRHVVRMLRGGKNSLRAELSQAFYREHKKAHRSRHWLTRCWCWKGRRKIRILTRFI